MSFDVYVWVRVNVCMCHLMHMIWCVCIILAFFLLYLYLYASVLWFYVFKSTIISCSKWKHQHEKFSPVMKDMWKLLKKKLRENFKNSSKWPLHKLAFTYFGVEGHYKKALYQRHFFVGVCLFDVGNFAVFCLSNFASGIKDWLYLWCVYFVILWFLEKVIYQ